jgi:hypothetical protein
MKHICNLTTLFIATFFAIGFGLINSPAAFSQSSILISDRSSQIASEDSVPIEVQSAVIEAAAQQTSRTVAALKILSSQPKNWPDSCLGFTEPGKVCAQAITPGWQVVVTDGLRNWTYRTNDSGDLIKLKESEQ